MMNSVFRYAIQTGRASYNSAADMRGVLKSRRVQHHPMINPNDPAEQDLQKLMIEDDAALDEVRRQLDEHGREPLDVPALARRAGVSQNHLSRRFRARHGMTLQRYLLGRRIELARHLLAVTRLPLKAVAIEAGLGNPQYFHRQFRRATGHSPSEERKLSAAQTV